ncbi:MAG: diacylglycerol kinase family lipid kinase, partial [Bacteroidetes bacterium]|nr:diacylglycerol kinase family lipid kinase [Bacteroidota bacterium]
TYREAVEVMISGNTFIQDIGMVSYRMDGHREERYLINMAGMGYDAMVAEKTNRMKDKGHGGPLVYLFNIFSSLLNFKITNTRLWIDGIVQTHKVFSMNVGICQFNGAGMKQLPRAVPDDGLFDVTVIRRISRFTVIKSVKKLYDGSFIKLPQVLTYTGKSIKVISIPPIYLEVDGESLGHSPLEFNILPRAIRVVVGEGFSENGFNPNRVLP